MTAEWFERFEPDFNTPLVVEFINYAKRSGYSTRMSFGYWDFYLYAHDDKPFGVVKSVKNQLSQTLMNNLMRESAAVRVILAEGDNFSLENLDIYRFFLMATGTGVFVRNIGWVVLPGKPRFEFTTELRLRAAPRWYVSSEGIWLKDCSKCGKSTPTDGFYERNSRTATDPYHHQCIECQKEKARARGRTRRGEKARLRRKSVELETDNA